MANKIDLKRCVLSSPGKLNLFLYVTGKREDGFHDLYSLMVPISLCDELVLDLARRDIRVSCDHPDVPGDATNLAGRAAALYIETCNVQGVALPFEGVGIHIDKNIPVGSGLGGGSSNAATVLVGLNRAAGGPLSEKTLAQIGRSLGADVPFFIFGRPAFARGVGELLEPVVDFPDCWAIVVNPGVSASTIDVYKKLDFRLTSDSDYTIYTGSNDMTFTFDSGWGENLHNDLERPSCKLYPEIELTKKEMAVLLGKTVHMSGSGSSLFALYPNHDGAKVDLRTLTNRWSGTGKDVFLVRVGQTTM